MIVAILALSMSVVGTAVAAGVFTKQEQNVIKQIANKQIDQKLTGPAKASGLRIVTRFKDLGVNDAFGAGTVNCPSGKRAVSGGAISDATSIDGVISSSFPVKGGQTVGNGATPDGWRTGVRNDGGPSIHPVIYAICVN
ncbi:MAG: hypothetical protein ACRDK1_02465 [Solirubrobacterales bacterium]